MFWPCADLKYLIKFFSSTKYNINRVHTAVSTCTHPVQTSYIFIKLKQKAVMIYDSVEWSGVPDSKVMLRGFEPTTLESETRDNSNCTIPPLPIRLTSEINMRSAQRSVHMHTVQSSRIIIIQVEII